MKSKSPLSHLVRSSLGAVCIVVLSGLAVGAAAQDQRVTDDQIAQVQERVDATRARLNLTPEQEQTLTPILTDSVEQRLGVLASYGFGDGANPKLSLRQKLSLRRELVEIRDATDAQVVGVLNEEQLAEYRTIQDENQEQIKARLQDRRAGAGR